METECASCEGGGGAAVRHVASRNFALDADAKNTVRVKGKVKILWPAETK
jgi:hypothetical protein